MAKEGGRVAEGRVGGDLAISRSLGDHRLSLGGERKDRGLTADRLVSLFCFLGGSEGFAVRVLFCLFFLWGGKGFLGIVAYGCHLGKVWGRKMFGVGDGVVYGCRGVF